MESILKHLTRLNEHGVELVVVGGVAAVMHGSANVTLDLDVCAPLNQENLERIVRALADLHPKFRMHPSKLPLPDDARQLVGFRNLNLVTDWGMLDILGEITGIGTYGEVARHTQQIMFGSITVRVLDLEALIQAKRASGRAKDLRAIPELEFMLKRQSDGSQDKQ